jgi:hypothetical protein
MGLLLALVSCGSVAAIPDAHDGDAPGSNSDLCATMNCDDGDSCTVDSCTANACTHTRTDIAHGQQTFGATGAIQTFTPDSCVRIITIEASGAHGGNATTSGQSGGPGAHLKGDFIIASGTKLSVLVGSPGGNATNVGGGGGGSFVWNPASPAQPLLVAGGGGGAGVTNAGQPGSTTQDGSDGADAQSGGGKNGSGGVAPTSVMNWAAGGAGWASDGAGGGLAQAGMCPLATGGKAPKNGGLGGTAGGNPGATGPGGFGGGGGAQGQCNATGGGGGGGYSGGGGGIEINDTMPSFTGGGGGGSFNAGTNAMSMPSTNAGPASVVISW